MKLHTWLFIFALSTSALGDTNFLFFGDWGTGSKDQKAVAQGMGRFCAARQGTCQFVINLGDNFYPSGVESVTDRQWQTKFHQVYDFLGLPFISVLGNHDYGGTPAAQVDYTRVSALWKMPARYYDFQSGDVAFFALDTNKFDAAQAAWLNQRLSQVTAPWKVVYGHHPIYSSGVHGSSKSLQRDLLPILANRAHFYLAGHDHHKEAIDAVQGVRFFISGAAAQTRSVKPSSQALFQSRGLGFGHLSFSGNKVRARFLGPQGQTEWDQSWARRPTTPGPRR